MLIAARNGFLAGGWKNPYITDGLVAMWDGEWNAGGGKHDANATSWVDLTGNGWDFPATNLVFASDHVEVMADTQTTKMSAEFWEWSAVSFDSVCERPAYNPSDSRNNGYFNLGRIGLYPMGHPINVLWKWIDSNTSNNFRAMYYNSSTAVERNQEVYELASRAFVANLNSSSAADQIAYQNARATNSSLTDLTWYTSTYQHGSLPFNLYAGTSKPVKLYGIRLYNRALTASEIAANYAVDKARFNLP